MKKMSMSERKRREDKKRSIEFYESCVKCLKCGHSVPIGRKDKMLCEFCGKYVFKDKKEEFRYRMGQIL